MWYELDQFRMINLEDIASVEKEEHYMWEDDGTAGERYSIIFKYKEDFDFESPNQYFKTKKARDMAFSKLKKKICE